LHPESRFAQAGFDKSRVVGSYFHQNDKLKATMNISKRLVVLSRKLAIQVVGVKLNQVWAWFDGIQISLTAAWVA